MGGRRAPAPHRCRQVSLSIVFDRGGGGPVFSGEEGWVPGGIEWDGSMDRGSHFLQKMAGGVWPSDPKGIQK